MKMMKRGAVAPVVFGALLGLASCRQPLLGVSDIDAGGAAGVIGSVGTDGAAGGAGASDGAAGDSRVDAAPGADAFDGSTDAATTDAPKSDAGADAGIDASDAGGDSRADAAADEGGHADTADARPGDAADGPPSDGGSGDAGGDTAEGGGSACGNVTIPPPVVSYSFDDCTDSSTKLRDDAAVGAQPAERGVGTRCEPGRDGQGLFFDGTTDGEVTSHVEARPDFQLPQITVAISVRPWRSPTAAIVGRWGGVNQFLLSYDSFGPRYLFSIGLPNAQVPAGDYYQAELAADDNVWVDLVGVFDNNRVRVYKDGVLAAEASITLPPRALQQTGNPLTLGYIAGDLPPNSSSSSPPTPSEFRGDLDGLRVWDKALTPEQVACLHCR